jgi:hypothetical protein
MASVRMTTSSSSPSTNDHTEIRIAHATRRFGRGNLMQNRFRLAQNPDAFDPQFPGREPAGRPATHMRRERRRGFWRAVRPYHGKFELPTMCAQPLLVAPRPKHVV